MNKSLSKTLSVLVFLSMVLPTSSKVFATGLSTSPIETNIVVTNNAGASDTVKVLGLTTGDVVTVYSETTGLALGTGSVGSGKSDATVTVAQLGKTSGNVFVSVKSTSSIESNKVEKAYTAEAVSETPVAANITVTNNAVGTPDTIVVKTLAVGDIVKVYSAAGTLIGTSTAATATGIVTVSIAQLGATAGSVTLSITSAGDLESPKSAAITVDAEAKSVTLDVADIVVTNNTTGKADTVVVSNVAVGDIVKVYSADAKLIGTSTAATATGIVTVNITQLGTAVGSITATVTSKGLLESDKSATKSYTAEAVSETPVAANITVTNNAVGTPDTIVVKTLAVGDIVKVYSAAGTLIGTSTAATATGIVTVSIAQLGATAGSVTLSITSAGDLESPKSAAITVDAEAKSVTLDVADIVVTNNTTGKADTVVVSNVAVGDIVKVYSADAKLIGTSTAATATGIVTVNITQLGTAVGSITATVTSKGLLESDKSATKSYTAEAVSETPVAANITVTNNAVGTPDTIVVKTLAVGDIVKVYSAAGTLIGTSTAATATGIVTVSIAQLGATAGSVTLSITSAGDLESPKSAAITVDAEAKSVTLDVADIVVTNNTTGKADTVVVSNVAVGDIVKVYSADAKLIGTSTAATATGIVTVNITQLGTAVGSITATVTSKGLLESDKSATKSYTAEAVSETPVAANITVTNNAVGTPDTIVVKTLAVGDIVKVYSAAGTLIGTSTAATATGIVTVSIAQLGATAGSVTLSITSAGDLESPKSAAITVDAEAKSVTLDVADIVVTNNTTGKADTVVVSNVAVGDIVKVYSADAKLIGTSTAATATGIVTVNITQLGTAVGSITATVTSKGLLESDKSATKSYTAEAVSETPVAANITVTNNAVGTPDTIVVKTLAVGDIVKVYSAAGTLIGTSTAATATGIVTVSIAQLGATAGSVTLSITSAGDLESPKSAAITVDAEAKSVTLDVADIVVTNNTTGKADTVVVSNVAVGDIVKVYSADAKLIGTSTAATATGIVTVNITQLGTAVGSITATVTSKGLLESDKSATKSYTAEAVSETPVAANITVTNNAVGTPDTIVVKTLAVGDIVKVYSAAGTLIGTSTAATATGIVTVSIAQLGATAGSVTLSITSAGDLESPKSAAITVDAEAKSVTLDVADIVVTNNTTGKADTVVVSNVAVGDIVKVYSADAKLIGTSTAATATGIVTVNITQLGTAVGSITATVTSKGLLESDKSATKSYTAEAVSETPVAANITVTNNAVGTPDTIVVKTLAVGDIVKVYSAAGTLIGTSTAATATGIVTVSIAQLGATAGSVTLSITSAGDLESPKSAAITVDAEAKSVTLDVADIVVTNNTTGKADTVVVSNVAVGDIVKVYSADAKLIGTSTAATATGIVTVNITQLGTAVGSITATVTSKGLLESDKSATKSYTAEAVSETPVAANITVTNNAVGTPDTIVVKTLAVGDIVKVYSAAGTLIGTSTAATATGIVTVSIAQLGATAGSVTLSITSAGDLESPKSAAITVDAEAKSVTLDVADIVVTNNTTGKADTVVVSNVAVGDIVKVYSADAKLIGTSTAATATGIVTVNITQLGTAVGSITATVTSKGLLESDKSATKSYTAEAVSETPVAANITVTNNAVGTPDTIVVKTLAVGDIVKVYSAAGTLIGTSTAATATGIVTVSIAQLGATAGSVTLSITSAGDLESPKSAAITVDAEAKSVTLDVADIVVTNNTTGKADTVVVSNVAVGDIVKVYSADAKLIGTSTAATATGIVTVNITQLGTAVGSITATVTSKGLLESDKSATKSYTAEAKSTTPDTTKITIDNYADIQDVITVTSLKVGDIVKVYSTATGGTAIATSKAVATGKAGISFNVAQLGATGGTVFLSVISTGMLESDRTAAVTVTAEL
ncbi:hypothetical protein KTC96_12895 [Clostridium estertheticum]|uniref:beta strand repeat-containing protein n=3 Tax=Clostridium estertheticum TaxID=238834 RepID=UPI0027150B1A|nr:hypothetical protein [Clostridium estertheticum]WLC68906.1 hypothetical protein KTC96_12895 [Clostridium estertheticum]